MPQKKLMEKPWTKPILMVSSPLMKVDAHSLLLHKFLKIGDRLITLTRVKCAMCGNDKAWIMHPKKKNYCSLSCEQLDTLNEKLLYYRDKPRGTAKCSSPQRKNRK
jgi:hypothetical protein